MLCSFRFSSLASVDGEVAGPFHIGRAAVRAAAPLPAGYLLTASETFGWRVFHSDPSSELGDRINLVAHSAQHEVSGRIICMVNALQTSHHAFSVGGYSGKLGHEMQTFASILIIMFL